MVSTHLKNMLVNMGIFPKVRDEKKIFKTTTQISKCKSIGVCGDLVCLWSFWDEWSRSSLPKLPFVARVKLRFTQWMCLKTPLVQCTKNSWKSIMILEVYLRYHKDPEKKSTINRFLPFSLSLHHLTILHMSSKQLTKRVGTQPVL